jgi:hypothetical protein
MLDRGKEFMDELTGVVSKFKSIVKDEKLWFLSGASFENEPKKSRLR